MKQSSAIGRWIGKGGKSREQWVEYLRSGGGGRGGGYDRDRVVDAGGGLTGDCSLTTISESSVLAKFSGRYTTRGMYRKRTSNGGDFIKLILRLR